MALAGISTLGVTLSYGVEATAGTKPETFSLLTRINGIGGITQDTEQIDASALEDTSTKYIAGRADTGGTCSVTVNLQVYSTGLGTDAFFFIAEPPLDIPMPESSQNELWTVEIPLAVVDYIGLDTKVTPS